MVLPLESPDYYLSWPRDLFVDELRVILAPTGGRLRGASRLLLREAFASEVPAQALTDADGIEDRDGLQELLRRAAELREARLARRPYRLERVGASAVPSEPDWDSAKRRYVRLFDELDENGYFDRPWGHDCVDARRDWTQVSDLLEAELGVPGLWPFQPDHWAPDLFMSIAEVLHDIVARPRTLGWLHSYMGCGFHHGDFAPSPGQALYRARVNLILEQARVPLRLAAEGEDQGRAVAVTDDAREHLLQTVLSDIPGSERDEVAHAIALFRSRTATRESKRSATNALARILEQHRQQVASLLSRADESALFQIANQFDIRHRDGRQHDDYDEAFLDWIFWLYLATIELLSRLAAREQSFG